MPDLSQRQLENIHKVEKKVAELLEQLENNVDVEVGSIEFYRKIGGDLYVEIIVLEHGD